MRVSICGVRRWVVAVAALVAVLGFAGDSVAREATPLARLNAQAASVKLNVFAMVSADVEDRVLQLSQELQKAGLESFPVKGYRIHCTLYMTRYPAAQEKAVVGLVASMAASVPAFPVRVPGLRVTKGNWLFVDLEKSPALQALADRVVNHLAPLRTPDSFVPDWVEHYPEKKENVVKYGSPNVFGQFEPHLTLLAKTDEALLAPWMAKMADSPLAQPMSGRIVAVGVGVADGSGQIKTPVAVFPLAE